MFGTKIEWCGYPMAKKFWRYVCSFPHNTLTWQTPRRTDTALRHRPRLHSIARQKPKQKGYIRHTNRTWKIIHQWKRQPDPQDHQVDSPCSDTATYISQEAQLSQRGRATRHVIENLAMSLKIVQGHSKLHRCNYVSILYRLWDIQLRIMACPWNLG